MKKSKVGLKTVSHLIGERIRQMRENSGILQEQLANVAREQFGLEWNQATVASIETGNRQLTLIEFLMLPYIVSFSGCKAAPGKAFVELSDLFAKSGDMVRIGKGAAVQSFRLQEIALGAASEAWGVSHSNLAGGGGWDTPSKRKTLTALPGYAKGGLRNIARIAAVKNRIAPDLNVSPFELENEAAGEAERKIARKFHISPFTIAVVARKKWKRSLSEERDARIKNAANTEPRRRQALRGHITRELIEELTADLERLPTRRKARREPT